jgi:hypothetical protein
MSRRLGAIVCGAIVPGWRGHVPPACFPRHVQLLLLGSAWAFQLAAWLRFGRPLGRLGPAEREALLSDCSASEIPAMRGLVQWWKLVALVSREAGP